MALMHSILDFRFTRMSSYIKGLHASLTLPALREEEECIYCGISSSKSTLGDGEAMGNE